MKENLDLILNHVLNTVLINKNDLRKAPNSNKIGKFVNSYVQYLGNINLSDTNPATMQEILNNYKPNTMTITHDHDNSKFEEHKLFDCPRQSYGNCSCTTQCENNNPEL
ncbi:hypothetical protein I5168_12025 [Nonlabens sp. SCSIO 43208]|uniref:hypothetical protein n=1 Tax=Nonlabens sp. SCSIO 43208 TaxID=2793009 RepID=UPI003D6A523E